MRKIKILKINPTNTSGTIEVGDDFTALFQGKFFRNPDTEEVKPSYTTPVPANSVLVKATSFDIIGNAKYSGRYTVYTSVSEVDAKPSVYVEPKTTIKVNELIPALSAEDSPTLASAGYITNISTYLLDVGDTKIVVPPAVTLSKYPVEFVGRDTSGWGEVFNQNFADLARNFAQDEAPENPFIGQMWFDTNDKQMRVFSEGGWDLLNKASFGTTYRHTQGAAASTWVINHFLGLPPPYIGFVQFFVDRGEGPKMIIPSNIVFDNPNRLTVTFSNPEIGYVLVRQ